MFKLECFFLYDICSQVIIRSNALQYEFDKYSPYGLFDPDLVKHVEFNPNYDCRSKYRDIIIDSVNNYEKDNDYFQDYDERTELFEYIYHVFCINKLQEDMLKKTYCPHPKIKDYIEEDSRLIGIHLDKINLNCTLDFNTVAAYDDLRINKTYPVDTIDLAITFKHVQKVNLKGFLNYEVFISPTVHKVHCSKETNNTYCYSLYGAEGANPFFIEIIFSDLDIEKKEHVDLPVFSNPLH